MYSGKKSTLNFVDSFSFFFFFLVLKFNPMIHLEVTCVKFQFFFFVVLIFILYAYNLYEMFFLELDRPFHVVTRDATTTV